MRALLDRLEPEYKRLVDELCPSQISYSGLQAVLKLLLAERVSIRNLSLILEAIAEVAPHVRRPEQIVEHVRVRHGAADLRRDPGSGRAARAAARQPLGHGLPSEPEARRQGRSGRIRHRPAADGAVRRRGVGRDPQAHGGKARLRPGDDGGDAHLRAHDHRAHVPDLAGAVAARDRARRSRSSRWARSPSGRERRHRAAVRSQPDAGGVRAVLPHRRLPDADAGLGRTRRSRCRSGCSSPWRRRCRCRRCCSIRRRCARSAPTRCRRCA